jgi:hypothetical protein
MAMDLEVTFDRPALAVPKIVFYNRLMDIGTLS